MKEHDKVTREFIISEIKRIANRNGLTKLSYKKFKKETGISKYRLCYLFSSWNEAVKEAGLEVTDVSRINDETLFQELSDVISRLGKFPSGMEFTKISRFSLGVYEQHFGAGGAQKLVSRNGFVKETLPRPSSTCYTLDKPR